VFGCRSIASKRKSMPTLAPIAFNRSCAGASAAPNFARM
jgi:hypothetical protein